MQDLTPLPMVGGKQVDGYGTAWLQPDGSWRYGTAQAESN